jgi:low affinity Fe/Cu permease
VRVFRKEACLGGQILEALNGVLASRPFGQVLFVASWGMADFFRKFSQTISHAMGQPGAFLLAVLVILVWGVTGPVFHFSDTWQLVINTGTTIVTFLMVFLIQNTQNRDTFATQLKLDELIRAISSARNKMIDLEHLSDQELEKLQKEFCQLKEHFEEKAVHVDQHIKEKVKKRK